MMQTRCQICYMVGALLWSAAAIGCGSAKNESTPFAPSTQQQTETKTDDANATEVVATKAPEQKPSSEQPAAAKKPMPTEIVPAEFVGLTDDVRTAAIALAKLGGEVEVGVGEKVISVDLDGKEVGDEQLAQLAVLADLKSLNLSNTAITNAGLKQLVSLKKLKFLYLFGTRITDAGMESLAGLPRLEVLCLDQTEITDVGLKSLEDLPRLEKLHVHSKAKITDAGLESLKKHTRLFELRIGGPHLSMKAIEALRAALPDCNVVYDPDAEAKAE